MRCNPRRVKRLVTDLVHLSTLASERGQNVPADTLILTGSLFVRAVASGRKQMRVS